MACTVLLSRILVVLYLVGIGLAQSETGENIEDELPLYESLLDDHFCAGPDSTIDICSVWYYGESEFTACVHALYCGKHCFIYSSVDSISFNFETEDFYADDSYQVSDNCHFPAFQIPITNVPYGTQECRCLYHNNFSVLTKFSLNEVNAALSLLSLGTRNGNPQFELIYDNCNHQFNLTFNEKCGEFGDNHEASYSFMLDSALQPDEWNRYAFEITDESIKFYMNCVLQGTMPVPRTNCSMECNNATYNNVIRELPGNDCGQDSSTKVS